jgi:hypothetical protein
MLLWQFSQGAGLLIAKGKFKIFGEGIVEYCRLISKIPKAMEL